MTLIKTKFLTIFLLLLFISPAIAQVTEVEAGDSTLTAAIKDATDGDVLELTSSGGLYLTPDKIVIDKNLTIRGKAELAEKPVIKYTGDSTGDYIFKVEGSPKVVFENVEIDGDGTTEGSGGVSKYALRLDNANVDGTMIVKVMDCVMHTFQDKVIKPYPDCGIDSLIVHNSIFYEGDKEGIVLYSGSSSDPAVQLEYAEFKNTTFYGFAREAIKADTNPDTKMLVDNCTFYNNGGTGKGLLYVDDLTDVEVKNSLFVKNEYTSYFTRYESDANLFHNNVVYDVVSFDVDGATVSDTIHADPMFADAANGDFTLAEASPARTAGEGGTPAGDLRWAIDPNKVVLTVLTVGNGVVTLEPEGGIYDPGTEVTLTAVPDADWLLDSWEGITVFPPDQNPVTVTVDEDMTVTAKFVSAFPQVTLTVDTLGLGYVEVTPEPSVDGTYNEGTEVTVTAFPRENWEFVEWLGDIDGSTNPVTFKVDSNMSVTASFQSIFTQFELEVFVEGKGTVFQSPEPILGTYDTAAVVTLTAEPVLGWEFKGWSGDLTGEALVDSVVMDTSKFVTATFGEIEYASHSLEIDTTMDLRDAVEIANNNSMIDSLVLITSGGLYTSYSTSDVAVMAPLTIVAKEGLDDKPVITNSDVEAGNDDIFRIFDDFTLKGVVLDGGHEKSHGMKYGIRLRHYDSDSVKMGTNLTIEDVDFINFFEDKNPASDGHAFKIDVEVRAGKVHFENCYFNGFGYEAIRISDTEKWLTDRALDTLIVRNSTFTNVDAEAIRYYSDVDPATPDAPVILEHLTIDSSATRAFYLKNSGGAIVRDIIISNSRESGHGRDGDLMDAQGEGTVVSHIDTFNVKPVPINAGKGGVVDTTTIWGIDPMYENASMKNYTLLPESHLYGLASDGLALGDLNWATNDPTHVFLNVEIEGEGMVEFDPAPIGMSYDPNTEVTMTAVPDSGYKFVEWTGDVTGSDNPVSVSLDQTKNVTAVFDFETGVDNEVLPKEFSLDQNYPNPFNPSTIIEYALPVQARVSVQIFNILGQEVITLVNNVDLEAGYQSVKWNGVNNAGSKVSTGIYIYRMEAKGVNGKNFINTKKMMLLK